MKNLIVHTAVKTYLASGKMLVMFSKLKKAFRAETVDVDFHLKGNRVVYTYKKAF